MLVTKGNNCSISNGDKRWNSKNCLWGCWRKVILLGVGGASFLFLLQHPSPWANCILPRFQSPYDYVATYKS